MSNKAIILDRDGTLNHDYGHVGTIDRFDFIEGVFEACKKFQQNNYLLIIITNQAGIAKEKYTLNNFLELNDYMIQKFKEKDIHISQVFYCPHQKDDECECRKPKSKMFDDAVKKFDLNESECIIIGDKLSDVMMGERSSCKKILIESQYTSEVDWEGILLTHKIIRKKDLLDACNHILESSS